MGWSGRKAGYGMLGGVIGAGLGGLLLDSVVLATHGGALSRGAGLGLTAWHRHHRKRAQRSLVVRHVGPAFAGNTSGAGTLCLRTTDASDAGTVIWTDFQLRSRSSRTRKNHFRSERIWSVIAVTKAINCSTETREHRWHFPPGSGLGLPASSSVPTYPSQDREALGPRRSASWFSHWQPVALPRLPI